MRASFLLAIGLSWAVASASNCKPSTPRSSSSSIASASSSSSSSIASSSALSSSSSAASPSPSVAVNLVTNPDFASNQAGWTIGVGGTAITLNDCHGTDSCLSWTLNNIATIFMARPLYTVPGQKYCLSLQYEIVEAGNNLSLGWSAGDWSGGIWDTTVGQWLSFGSSTTSFIATASITELYIGVQSSGGTVQIYFTNVVVRSC